MRGLSRGFEGADPLAGAERIHAVLAVRGFVARARYDIALVIQVTEHEHAALHGILNGRLVYAS